MIYERLLARYPSLVLPPHSDPTESLPLPPQEVELDWGGSHLLELEEEWDPVVDWDDVGMAIAAEIVNEVRGRVKEKLGYTCSAGVAQNRMLAKLGSGYKKPNQQVRWHSRVGLMWVLTTTADYCPYWGNSEVSKFSQIHKEYVFNPTFTIPCINGLWNSSKSWR